MIPAANIRTVSSNGIKAGAEFGISIADSAHLMTILRDTLYSDKVLAVIREYSANAWDSHRTSGKADVPIKIHLPTSDDLTLSIRDFGKGLSQDEVFNVYTQYGASTKRDDDQAVGMLGIGSKSGFAYSDTFTVTSFHGGFKRIYSAVLDPSDKGIISMISETSCGDETGIMIEIPVKMTDVHEFHRKAKELFVHFDPRPSINIDLPEPQGSLGKYKSGTLFSMSDYRDTNVIAVMGCIPYRVSLYQVKEFEEGLPTFMENLHAALFFEIGDVHINASREELKYSDKTKRAIIDRLNAVVSEYVQDVVKKVEDPALSCWSKRLAAQQLRNFGLFVPKALKAHTEYSVTPGDKIPAINLPLVTNPDGTVTQPKDPLFWMSDQRRKRISSIGVHPTARIIIKNDGRTMKGFKFTAYDVIIHRGQSKPKHVEMPYYVNKMLKDTELVGIPVLKTSDMEWNNPRGPVGIRTVNTKHGQKFFLFNPNNVQYSYGRRGRKKEVAPSSCWEIVQHVPEDTDVYVEISHFRVDYDFTSKRSEDAKLAAEFGLTMPPVYGYKVTERDPSKPHKGLEYRAWRKELANTIASLPKFQETLGRDDWYSVLGDYPNKINSSKIDEKLGKDHIISKFFRKYTKMRDDSKNRYISEPVDKVERIIGKFDPKTMPAQKRLAEILEKYPIFTCEGVRLDRLGVELDLDKWVAYIQTIDQKVTP